MLRFLRWLPLVAISLLSACRNPEQESYKHLIQRIESTRKSATPEIDSLNTLIAAIDLFISDFPESEHKRTLREKEQVLRRLLTESRYQYYVELYKYTTERSYDEPLAAIDSYSKCLDELSHQRAEDLRANHIDLVRYIDNLRTAIDGLQGMHQFFQKPYDNLSSFNTKATSIGRRWEGHKLLNKLWKSFVSKARRELAKQVLVQGLPYVRSHLEDHARLVCQGAYSGFNVQRVELAQLEEPQEDSKRLGYLCSAIYHVYLRGAYFGIDKGLVKLRVHGTLSIEKNEQGIESSLVYTNNSYEILEKQGV